MSNDKEIRIEKSELINALPNEMVEARLKDRVLFELANHIKYEHGKDEKGNNIMVAYIDIMTD